MGRGFPFIDRRESPEKLPLPSLTSISDETVVTLFITALETVLSTYYIKIVDKACQIVIHVAAEGRSRVRGW